MDCSDGLENQFTIVHLKKFGAYRMLQIIIQLQFNFTDRLLFRLKINFFWVKDDYQSTKFRNHTCSIRRDFRSFDKSIALN